MGDESSETQEKDINDVFCSISFSEEKVCNEAFHKGFLKGQEDGKLEGYHLGFHKGLQWGMEIGFYKGLVKSLLDNFEQIPPKNNEKTYGLLLKMKDALENFPKENDENIDIEKQINIIRAYYRKLNSFLKFDFSFSVDSVLSF